MHKSPTIHDVAQLSGVSVASVSRVLSKSSYPVSQKTRGKVLAAVKTLNYTVNITGKMLKTQKTKEIGVIVPNISNPSYAQLVQGIQTVAIQNGYHILLYNSNRNNDMESRNFRSLLEKRVDGILLVSINNQCDLLKQAKNLQCPLITLEQEIEGINVHVGYDYLCACALSTRYLIEHGHRRIAFVGMQIDRPSRAYMLAGYREAMSQNKLPISPSWEWLAESESECTSIFEIENAKAAVQHYLSLQMPPSGYVCLNDLTALGVIWAFGAAGVKIPQDVSVIGFDNIIYSELSTPKLTTIDQYAEQMGQTAMALMNEQITNPQSKQSSVQLKPKLIIRDSVAHNYEHI